MAMFLYRSNSGEQNRIYEGDFMIRKEEYIEIRRKPRNSETVPTKVAIFRLLHGESVEEVNES